MSTDQLATTAHRLREQISELALTFCQLEHDFIASDQPDDTVIRETDASVRDLLETILGSRRLCGEVGACWCPNEPPDPRPSLHDPGMPLFGPDGEWPVFGPDGEFIDT